MKPEDKRRVIMDLQQQVRKAKVAILTRYVGLNVEKMTQLRRELRNAAIHYRIVKNTLLRLALQGTDKEPLGAKIEGPVALAWSETDPVAPAKVLAKFAKDYPEVQILVASSGGKLYGPAEIQEWVLLPSLRELRGRIVGFVQAPAGKLVQLMATPGTRLAQILQARSEPAKE